MPSTSVSSWPVGRLSALFVGRDRRRTLAFLGLAVAIAAAFGGGPLLLDLLGMGPSGTRYFEAMLVVTLVAAAANAYYNEGLVVSWLLAVAGLLPFALTFALTDAPIGREPTLANATSELLGSAGLYGVAVGTAGFVVGIGVRGFLAPGRRDGSARGNEGADES